MPSAVCMLLDVVLGHGAHPDPAAELAPAIRAALAGRPEDDLAVVASLIGTADDPQDIHRQADALREAGAHGLLLERGRRPPRCLARLRGPAGDTVHFGACWRRPSRERSPPGPSCSRRHSAHRPRRTSAWTGVRRTRARRTPWCGCSPIRAVLSANARRRRGCWRPGPPRGRPTGGGRGRPGARASSATPGRR